MCGKPEEVEREIARTAYPRWFDAKWGGWGYFLFSRRRGDGRAIALLIRSCLRRYIGWFIRTPFAETELGYTLRQVC